MKASRILKLNLTPILTVIFSFLMALPAQSYLEFMDNGDVLDAGHFKINTHAQGIFNDYDGFNFTGRISTSATESSEVQLELGFGSFETQLTAYFKYVPFPDTQSQPAIGIRAGGSFARFEGETLVGLHLQPFLSKRFDTEYGRFTPHGALNLSVISFNDDSEMPLQFLLGTAWKPSNFKFIEFYTEVGLNLAKSYNFIAAGASINFDSFSNIQFK